MSGLKLLPCTVFLLNIVAFGLAIVAELKRTKGQVFEDAQKMYQFCKYGSGIATVLGIGAFLILMLSSILVMVASRHSFSTKPAFSDKWSAWMFNVLIATCWAFYLAGEICLWYGSVRNAYRNKYRTLFVFIEPQCDTVRRGVFAAAAGFIVFATLVFEMYYILYSEYRVGENKIQPSEPENGDFEKAQTVALKTKNQGNNGLDLESSKGVENNM